MPALHLDVALFHLNRADERGNAQFLGPDLYFDDLFASAAETTLRVAASRSSHRDLAEADAVPHAAHQPPAWSTAWSRRPGGAALHLVHARLRRATRRSRRRTPPRVAGRSATASPDRPGCRRPCRRPDGERRERTTHPGRDLRRGGGRVLPGRRRDPGQPHRHHPHDRRPPGPGHLRARPGDDRRRRLPRRPTSTPWARTAIRQLEVEAWNPYRTHVRRGLGRPAPRDDGRHPGRPVRQPEHRLHRRPAQAEGAAPRLPGRPGQHDQPPHQLLGAQPLAQGLRGPSTWSPASATTGAGLGDRGVASTRSAGWSSNLGVFDFETPDHRMRLRSVHPGVTVDEVESRPPASSWPSPTTWPNPGCPPTRSCADPRGDRSPGPPGGRGPVLSPHPALHTALCDLVGVRYPIVQTGMGWVAGARLVSATANAGGLGILAGRHHGLRPARRRPSTRSRRRTDAPFGVNLRADAPDAARPHRPAHRRGRQGRLVRPGPEART